MDKAIWLAPDGIYSISSGASFDVPYIVTCISEKIDQVTAFVAWQEFCWKVNPKEIERQYDC